MDKRARNFLIGALIVILAQGSFLMVWILGSKSKTAYVRTEEVYNDFELKKELEKKLESTRQTRQLLLDSLQYRMQLLTQRFQLQGGKPDEAALAQYNLYREDFFQKQKQFEEDNQALASQYTEQIWKQLNQYVKDYGSAQGYKYIFGAQGDGALMYADDADNITAEMKMYVNNRYKGKE